MTTIAITSLPVVTTGLVGDVIPVVQNGVTSQITNANLFNSVATLTVNGLEVGRGAGTNTSSVAIGGGLSVNTTGTGNVAIGNLALAVNTTGLKNIAIGTNTLKVNVDGFSNIAIGFDSQQARTTARQNVSIGDSTLRLNVSGLFNTAVGGSALAATTGSTNTCIGYLSGFEITTGSNNVILGNFDGNTPGVLDIRTATTGYVVLSNGNGDVAAYWNGADATFSGSLTLPGTIATSAVAATVPSGSTITPLKAIAFISGTTVVNTISPPSNMLFTGGTITLIPTGAFTWTTAGNIALAGTAVVSKALIMTYDYGTGKWYPSYT